MKIYWGDTHANFRTKNMPEIDDIIRKNMQCVDFAAFAYYPYGKQEWKNTGYFSEKEIPFEIAQRDWEKVCELAERYNSEGEFILFPGYEWQGNGRDGDHNIIFNEKNPPMILVSGLKELYDTLKKENLEAIAIPHHTAYQPGVRSKNWNIQDDLLSPVTEIYSCHGCSESDDEYFPMRRNWHMGPNVSGGTVEDALNMGHKIGIIASPDSQNGNCGVYGNGLMACIAESLTKNAIWNAIKSRHVYAVTGDRIKLDFKINDAIMGDIISGNKEQLNVYIDVCGSDALDRIELLKNNRLIECRSHNGTWDKPSEKNVKFKIRYEMGWGPLHSAKDLRRPKKWDGRITLDEGCIIGLEKCFIRQGQRARIENDNTCSFNIDTGSPVAGSMPETQSVILEIEAPLNAKLKFESGNWRDEADVAELIGKSKIIIDPEQAGDIIFEDFGVKHEELERHDDWYFFAFKVKRHRAIPESGYKKTWSFELPFSGEAAHYRVRVGQRNRQTAWSSPVWIE